MRETPSAWDIAILIPDTEKYQVLASIVRTSYQVDKTRNRLIFNPGHSKLDRPL